MRKYFANCKQLFDSFYYHTYNLFQLLMQFYISLLQRQNLFYRAYSSIIPGLLLYHECSSGLISNNHYFTLDSSRFTFEVPGDLCKLERVCLQTLSQVEMNGVTLCVTTHNLFVKREFFFSLPPGAACESGRVTFLSQRESFGASAKGQLVSSVLAFAWSCCPEVVWEAEGVV